MLTAALPETRTYSDRRMAVIGDTLIIQQGKKANRYAMTRIPSCTGIVRYELAKADGTVYTTQVIPFTQAETCNCAARRRCCHLDAVRMIAEQGGDELETISDLTANAEELDAYYA
jgi:hypothetical protein